jgi:hypothetical protein
MLAQRDAIVQRILAERERQRDLPNAEWDTKNGPNDWCAISAHYLMDQVRRGGRVPVKEDFEEALVKAAAVIVAALEHSDEMTEDMRLSAGWAHG